MITDKLIFNKHLEKGEKILYAVHKHWIDMVKPASEVIFFGLFLPWTLYLAGFNSLLFFWIAVIWSALAVCRYIYVLVDWFCDTWLITDMSVITITWKGIFSNTSARISFEDIEGAAYEIKGFFGTIFRFGDMTLRVMSGSHAILKNVASPKKAELAVAKFQGSYLNDRNMQDTDSLKTLLSKMVVFENRGK